MDVKQIKLLVFDLDGTLTDHKQPISRENRAALDELGKRCKLLMAGAGRVMRIFEQIGKYPIDIIGNYGLQYGEYSPSDGEIKIKKDLVFPCEIDSVVGRIEKLRQKHGFTEYRGNSVELHPSGCVTFPILGTEALYSDKIAFDPDRKKRRAIYAEVAECFPEYSVFVGGSSSFDMAPKPYNKYYALKLYCEEHGYMPNEVVFVGDDYGHGGNDEPIYRSEFGFVKTDDYRKFPEIMSEFLY